MPRVLMDTYGCTLNKADSDIMSGILKEGGFEVEKGGHSSKVDHDYVLVNTCTVKIPTETKIIERIRQVSKTRAKVIVTGCMASANRDKILRAAPNASIVTTSNIHRIAEALQETAKSGLPISYDSYTRSDKAAILPSTGQVVARIPISEGCLSSCSFCETKFARGPLNSFSEKLILKAISMSVEKGAKEIELTSQDVGAYGLDRSTNIAELLELATDISGEFKLRVGMLNPEHLGKYLDRLLLTFRSGKLYKFLHLPVQSGSDDVLRHMDRNYTVSEFGEYVCEARKKVPGISIATDIIVGYPTETRQDFDKSLAMVERERPTFTNVSKFGARPHARASRLEPLDVKAVKGRAIEMSRSARSVQREDLSRLVGTVQQVLVTEKNDKSFTGRDECYRVVALDAKGISVGDVITARIVSNSSVCLLGKLA